LSHFSKPLGSCCFRDGSCFLQANLVYDPSILLLPLKLGWQICPTMLTFFSVEMGSHDICLPRLSCNHDSPNLSLLHNLGWQAHATTSSYWFEMGSW
jgi:hypothetical protein